MRILNEENINVKENVKLEKNAEDYKLVDILDDLFESNRAQMIRRNYDQEEIDEEVAASDAAIDAKFDAEIEAKYPSNKQYTDTEKAEMEKGKEKIEAERLRSKAQAQQKILDNADFSYEQVGNLLVMGEPGGGKTSIIQEWAKQKKVGLVTVTGGDIDENVTKGTPFARQIDDVSHPGKKVDVCAMLPSEFFAQLDNPNYKYTVLFVDEINRAYAEAEGALLTLVQDRTIQDRNWNLGRHKFDKFLFTIAAMNPPSYDPQANHGTGGKKKGGANSEARMLSNAMLTRFTVFYWNSDPDETLKFIDKTLDKNMKKDAERVNRFDTDSAWAATHDADDIQIFRNELQTNKARKEIADTLLGHGNFRFADEGEIAAASKGDPKNIHVLNARTLLTALLECDGTIGKQLAGLNTDSDKSPYTPASFMDRVWRNCTKNENLLKKIEYMLKPLADARETNSEAPVNQANNINTNLLALVNNWKETFGGDYGITI